jgi:type III restriction enzyme
MPQVTIDNPILNSAFDAPTHHFRFDLEGITTDVENRRRASAFFMPIARARKNSFNGGTHPIDMHEYCEC